MAGLFGGFKLPPLPGPISGYGGGTFNMDGTQATPVDTQPFIPTGDFGPRPAGIDQAAAYTGPAKKGGLFGSKFNEPGGWGEKLALIGSVLTQDGGNNPNVQGIMLRRQMEAAAQRAQAQRQAELQNQMALYDYKRANPMPLNNDTVNDFNWFKSLSESDRQLYAQLHPQFITTDNGDGTKTVVPVTPGMFNQHQAPQQPMHDLPPGYSITGGPGRNAGGGFR